MATNPWDDPFERVRANRAAAGLRPEPVFRPLQFGSSGIDVQYGPPPVRTPNPTLRSTPEMAAPNAKITMDQVNASQGQGGARPAAPGVQASVVETEIDPWSGKRIRPPKAPAPGFFEGMNRVLPAAVAADVATRSMDRYGIDENAWRAKGGLTAQVVPASLLGAATNALAAFMPGVKGDTPLDWRNRNADAVYNAVPKTWEEAKQGAVSIIKAPIDLAKEVWREGPQRMRALPEQLQTPFAGAAPSMRAAMPATAPTAAAAATGEMGPPAPTDAQLWNRDLKDREAALAAVRARSQGRPEFSAIGLDDADTARNLRQTEQMRANIANFPEQYTNAQGEVIRPRENAMRSMQEGAYNAGPAITEAQAKQTLAERLAGYENAMRSMRESRAIQAGVPVEAMEATGGNLRQAIAMSRAAAASNLARNARPMPGYGGRGGYGPQAATAPAQPASPYTPEGMNYAVALAGGDPVLAAEMFSAMGQRPQAGQPRTPQDMTTQLGIYSQLGKARQMMPGPASQVPLADVAGVRREPVKGVFNTMWGWLPGTDNEEYAIYNQAGQRFPTGVTARGEGWISSQTADPVLEGLRKYYERRDR